MTKGEKNCVQVKHKANSVSSKIARLNDVKTIMQHSRIR